MSKRASQHSPDDYLAAISDNPTVREQLKTALSPEELEYLLFRYDLRPAQLVPRKKDEQADRQRLRHLGLPPLQERLFRALECESEGLLEEEAAAIVYPLEWHKAAGRQQATIKNRLRVLKEALNDKLRVAKSPLRVVRPKETNNLLILRNSRKKVERKPVLVPREHTRPVEQCMRLIQSYLAGGRQDSIALHRYCEAHGYSTGTVIRAKKKLGVHSVRVGYGAEGKWLVGLPAKKSAHL